MLGPGARPLLASWGPFRFRVRVPTGKAARHSPLAVFLHVCPCCGARNEVWLGIRGVRGREGGPPEPR